MQYPRYISETYESNCHKTQVEVFPKNVSAAIQRLQCRERGKVRLNALRDYYL